MKTSLPVPFLGLLIAVTIAGIARGFVMGPLGDNWGLHLVVLGLLAGALVLAMQRYIRSARLRKERLDSPEILVDLQSSPLGELGDPHNLTLRLRQPVQDSSRYQLELDGDPFTLELGPNTLDRYNQRTGEATLQVERARDGVAIASKLLEWLQLPPVTRSADTTPRPLTLSYEELPAPGAARSILLSQDAMRLQIWLDPQRKQAEIFAPREPSQRRLLAQCFLELSADPLQRSARIDGPALAEEIALGKLELFQEARPVLLDGEPILAALHESAPWLYHWPRLDQPPQPWQALGDHTPEDLIPCPDGRRLAMIAYGGEELDYEEQIVFRDCARGRRLAASTIGEEELTLESAWSPDGALFALLFHDFTDEALDQGEQLKLHILDMNADIQETLLVGPDFEHSAMHWDHDGLYLGYLDGAYLRWDHHSRELQRRDHAQFSSPGGRYTVELEGLELVIHEHDAHRWELPLQGIAMQRRAETIESAGPVWLSEHQLLIGRRVDALVLDLETQQLRPLVGPNDHADARLLHIDAVHHAALVELNDYSETDWELQMLRWAPEQEKEELLW